MIGAISADISNRIANENLTDEMLAGKRERGVRVTGMSQFGYL